MGSTLRVHLRYLTSTPRSLRALYFWGLRSTQRELSIWIGLEKNDAPAAASLPREHRALRLLQIGISTVSKFGEPALRGLLDVVWGLGIFAMPHGNGVKAIFQFQSRFPTVK